jgi:hypothetical protein
MSKPVIQKIHDRFCGTHGRCWYGTPLLEPVSRACKELDVLLSELIGQAGDDRAHVEAEKLLGMHMDTLLTHGPQVTQGFALAITIIDPYVMRDGRLVRQADGTPVKETS